MDVYIVVYRDDDGQIIVATSKVWHDERAAQKYADSKALSLRNPLVIQTTICAQMLWTPITQENEEESDFPYYDGWEDGFNSRAARDATQDPEYQRGWEDGAKARASHPGLAQEVAV
jgi:thiamine kinase-like enzyme